MVKPITDTYTNTHSPKQTNPVTKATTMIAVANTLEL